MIDRYGLHLKVIHNDVTDRLAQLLKQCSYYLQQQQKPMEVSIGKVYICKYHVTLLLNYHNVDIRIRVTGVSYLYWFSVIPVCTIVFSHVLHILYRQRVQYFIFLFKWHIYSISYAHVLKNFVWTTFILSF